jgi:hypothetical protein
VALKLWITLPVLNERAAKILGVAFVAGKMKAAKSQLRA